MILVVGARDHREGDPRGRVTEPVDAPCEQRADDERRVRDVRAGRLDRGAVERGVDRRRHLRRDLLGLRHATDPDHIAAVTTLVASGREQRGVARPPARRVVGARATRSRSSSSASRSCSAERYLPERVQQGAETAVAALIVFLAVRLLVRWRHGAFDRTHDEPTASTGTPSARPGRVRDRARARHGRQRRRRRAAPGCDPRPRRSPWSRFSCSPCSPRCR